MVKYSFEQVNIFFCTIVVALNGQPDFFMKITPVSYTHLTLPTKLEV